MDSDRARSAAARRDGDTGSGLRGIPPDLLQPAIATAAVAVVLVADGVLFVIVLMVALGRVERCRRLDPGGDGLPEARVSLQRGLAGRRLAPLLVIDREDGAAVLVPAIAELAVDRHRVDVVPEHFQQLWIADPARVVGHPHCLRVSGAPGRYLLVGRTY